jgi:hypothetical protein
MKLIKLKPRVFFAGEKIINIAGGKDGAVMIYYVLE